MEYKVFFRQQVLVALAAIAGVGLFNYGMDPYGLIHNSLVSERPVLDNHSRLIKSVEVVRSKPEVLILGTSRMKRLKTENPIFQDLGPTYNLSLAGSSVYEQRRYLEHTLSYQPQLKFVVMGLDFFSFSEDFDAQPGFVNGRLGQQLRIQEITVKDWQNIILSLDALGDSWETLGANAISLRSTANAEEPAPKKQVNDIENSKEVLKSYLKRSDRYYNYRLGDKKIQEFKRIVDFCREHNIQLVAIIPPVHATQLETIYQAGLWSVFQEWKVEITGITSVWDFSGYNEITQEPLSEEMDHYDDPSHFRPEIADLMLENIFGEKDDFGIILNSKNVNRQNEELTAQRKEWMQNNNDDWRFVNLIAENR